MEKTIGKTIWAIAEGYIPEWSNGPEPQLTSHETVCILNTSNREAKIAITIYFSDRDPIGPYKRTVPAKRTEHIRWFFGFVFVHTKRNRTMRMEISSRMNFKHYN